MQQKPYRNTNMEFSSRATGYTRRPVADVQSRYKTTKPKPLQPLAQSEIKQTVKAKQTPQVHPHQYSKEIKQQTINTTHRIKSISGVRRAPTNHAQQKQFIVPNDHTVPARQHIQPMSQIPTLPTPKENLLRATVHKIRSTTKKQASGVVLSILAVVLLGVGIAVNIHSFSVSKKIEAQAASVDGSSENGGSGNTGGYSETQPTTQSINEYKVAADLPRLLQIPSLGTLARVKRVGVDNNNQVGSPQNVFDVAWYDGSSKPGQPGAVFIDGHVLGPTKGGIFANLKNISVGAEITIIMGDGKSYTYKVAATEVSQSDSIDMNKMLRSYDASRQGLNLMTCNGTYLKDKKTFDKRFIVYAVREN